MAANRSATPRPGMALVGTLAIAAGLALVVAAVLAAIAGKESSPAGPTTTASTDGESGPSDVASAQDQQVVRTRDGSLSFEAPAEWTTRVEVSSQNAGTNVTGAGAVSTTYDDYKSAKTDGIVAVVTDPMEPTSAGLVGAILGNSSVFCPTTACTTGKPNEKDVQLPSPLTQVDSQFTVSEPATDDDAGELRYTIETEAPTRYIVIIARTTDPGTVTEVLEHAVATLTLD